MYTAAVQLRATPSEHLDQFNVVHSVFAQGFNIAARPGTSGQQTPDAPNPLLLWVDTSRNPMVVPHSMRVTNSDGFPKVEQGNTVSYDATDASLIVGAALKLDLTTASTVDTKLPTGSSLTHPDFTEVLQRKLALHRASRAPADPVSYSTIIRNVNEHLGAFIVSLVNGDTLLSDQHLAKLVGYGSGLTPSGDDALLGAFAFMQMYYPESAALVPPLLRDRLRSTTDVSGSYLSLALDGHVAVQIREVLSAFSGVRNDRALTELLSTGHSSGEDIVRGIVIAAQTL